MPVPTIDGDAKHYVGPDGIITLRCQYSSSLNRKDTTWLLNGADVGPTLGDGNDIVVTPTSSTLRFTQFNRTVHSGSYQCRVEGLLGDLVSRMVDVLPASECSWVCVQVRERLCVCDSGGRHSRQNVALCVWKMHLFP